jgi:5-methylcytosine-specific restriction endonuclease McrA
VSRALVLNATYEPLCVVASRRALLLVMAGKAETLEASGRLVRAERVTFPEPSVVRLARYVRVPVPRRRALNRGAVLLRDDHTCQYCGAPAESIDHVVPRSRGGEHTWENVVAACLRCNTQKRDRLLHETSMRLPRPPRPPAFMARVVLADRRLPDAWSPYLHRGLERSSHEALPA